MALSKTFPIGSPLTASDVNDHLVNHVPAPGDEYDTGWVDLTLAPGFSGEVLARRIGLLVSVIFDVTVASPTAANTAFTTPLREDFRPPAFTPVPVFVNPPAEVAAAQVYVDPGGGHIRTTGALVQRLRGSAVWAV